MSYLDNAVTGMPAVLMSVDDVPPEGATHWDTNYYTCCRWHALVNGEWAYFNNDGNWKVYDNQEEATVADFIKL